MLGLGLFSDIGGIGLKCFSPLIFENSVLSEVFLACRNKCGVRPFGIYWAWFGFIGGFGVARGTHLRCLAIVYVLLKGQSLLFNPFIAASQRIKVSYCDPF